MASGTSTTAPSTARQVKVQGNLLFLLLYKWKLRTRPVSFKELFKVLGRLLVVSRQCSLLNHTAPCRIFPARCIRHPCRLRQGTAPLPYAAMPAMSARPTLPMGYYGQGNQFPFAPNPNWMFSEREQMLQQQLIQERQQFEAWRASQAQPQPQPPISSAGPVQVGGDVEIIKERSASTSTKMARPEDQVSVKAKRARSASTSRSSPPPLPRGTTLGGLAQPQGHLRPVLNRLSIRLLLPRTLKPLKLT